LKFDLVRPCAKCPFRSDIEPYLHAERGWELRKAILNDATFACHETMVETEGGEDMTEGPNSQHCAGVLVILERMKKPNQMVRIAERLGMYDRRKLDMESPCFPDLTAFAKAQEDAYNKNRKSGPKPELTEVTLYNWVLEYQEVEGDHPTLRQAASHFQVDLNEMEGWADGDLYIEDNDEAYMGLLVGTRSEDWEQAEYQIEAE
jgi:hypothetical protein